MERIACTSWETNRSGISSYRAHLILLEYWDLVGAVAGQLLERWRVTYDECRRLGGYSHVRLTGRQYSTYAEAPFSDPSESAANSSG